MHRRLGRAVMPASANRVVGIDVARSLAILGMIALHALPGTTLESIPVVGFLVDDGRPQLLFAVLDGLSVGIITQVNAGYGRSQVRRSISIRAVFLIALGLFVTGWNSGVIVILDYYGVFLLLSIPFLFLRTRTLLLAFLFSAALGGVAVTLAFRLLDGVSVPMIFQQLFTWILWGQYPAITWFPYVLLGMWIARVFDDNLKRSFLFSLIFLVASIVLFWASFLLPESWSHVAQSAKWASSGALAGSIIFFAIPVFRNDPKRASFISTVLASMGRMPVTVYVLHVVVISLLVENVGIQGLQSIGTFWLVLIICWTTALAFSALKWRGPLEMWVSWMARATAPLSLAS